MTDGTELLNGKSILLVEDNEDNIFSIKILLKSFDPQLTVALTGEEAIDFVSKSDYDIILMDIRLPGMNGYETITKIKSLSKMSDVPIIAVTAQAMSGDREKCLEAGADEYIPKPVNNNDLISKMVKCLAG